MHPILLVMWTAFQSFILRDNNNDDDDDDDDDNDKCIHHGLCNLFLGVLHGMLFCCFISGRLYI